MTTEKVNVKKGLEGVIVDDTQISKVMPKINALVYRGYPVPTLAKKCSFEEVAYLMWNEELPTKAQLDTFVAWEKKERNISSDLIEVIKKFPKKAHPMDTIRTGISFLGMEDERVWDREHDTNLDKAMKVWAKTPTIIAADYRTRKGLEIIPPNLDLNFSENFFYMCFGEVPHKTITRAFDASLTLYAEHSFNASTFTSRVVSSTLSDLYSSIVAAVGALKGPLHGGANEQVMYMLKEIGETSKAKEWTLNALKNKTKIMGFGHRVYKKGDSRAPTMDEFGRSVAEHLGNMKWHEISEIVEKTMIAEKDIYPNLDFPAGPAYHLMGFDIDMFTPIFVMSRITGWAAHIIEQTENNRIIRPLSNYNGQEERSVTTLSERG